MTQRFSLPRKRTMTIVSLLFVFMLLPTFVSLARDIPPDCTLTHRVRWGDALGTISHYYGASVSDLMSWNGIGNPHLIITGTEICVSKDPQPARPPAGWTAYRVRWGDTLSQLAWVFGASIGDLVVNNSIGNPDWIFAGETLYHP